MLKLAANVIMDSECSIIVRVINAALAFFLWNVATEYIYGLDNTISMVPVNKCWNLKKLTSRSATLEHLTSVTAIRYDWTLGLRACVRQTNGLAQCCCKAATLPVCLTTHLMSQRPGGSASEESSSGPPHRDSLPCGASEAERWCQQPSPCQRKCHGPVKPTLALSWTSVSTSRKLSKTSTWLQASAQLEELGVEQDLVPRVSTGS